MDDVDVDLTETEQALVEALEGGQPFSSPAFDDADPGRPDDAAPSVRAEVVRRLGRGLFGFQCERIEIAGLRVVGDVNLEFAELPAMRLVWCRLDELRLNYASMPLLALSGSSVASLDSSQGHIRGDVVLNEGFECGGLVIDHATIGGSLIATNAAVGRVFAAQALKVRSDVLLDGGFASSCAVRLDGADIGGQVDCSGARLSTSETWTLALPQSRVGGDVVLGRGFVSTGEVSLAGAEIRGQLSCGGGELHNPDGDALTGDQLVAERGVFMNRGFAARGTVRLLGARIGGQLDLSGGRLEAGSHALTADQARVRGGVFLEDGFSSRGTLSLMAMEIEGQVNAVAADIEAGESGVALYLEDTIVGGNASFERSSFTGTVRLVGTEFGGSLSFTDASLTDRQDGASLRAGGATVSRGLLIRNARIDGGAQLTRMTVSGTVQTSGAHVALDASSGVVLDGLVFAENTRLHFDGNLSLPNAVVRGPLTLVPKAGSDASLESLVGASLEAPLVVPDGVSLRSCALIDAIGLGQLLVLASDPGWRKHRGRRSLADEHAVYDARSEERSGYARAVEGLYRQLRAALEASKAAPAAADFYYGEMEMRRIAAPRASVERSLLLTYKATSGYGLRAWRALATLACLILAAAAALRWSTDVFISDTSAAAGVRSGTEGLSFQKFGDVVALVARTSVSLVPPTTAGLTAWGTALLLTVRLAGPLFLALALLAVRARVQR